jgi:flagellar biosynthesis activator protein FlaF
MYQFSYAEILDDSPQLARERERHAVERSIELLQAGETAGTGSREALEAVVFTERLWAALMEDLANPGNALAPSLRAELISIGVWVMREADQIRLGQSKNFKGLIEVSAAIRDGLK